MFSIIRKPVHHNLYSLLCCLIILETDSLFHFPGEGFLALPGMRCVKTNSDLIWKRWHREWAFVIELCHGNSIEYWLLVEKRHKGLSFGIEKDNQKSHMPQKRYKFH